METSELGKVNGDVLRIVPIIVKEVFNVLNVDKINLRGLIKYFQGHCKAPDEIAGALTKIYELLLHTGKVWETRRRPMLCFYLRSAPKKNLGNIDQKP